MTTVTNEPRIAPGVRAAGVWKITTVCRLKETTYWVVMDDHASIHLRESWVGLDLFVNGTQISPGGMECRAWNELAEFWFHALTGVGRRAITDWDSERNGPKAMMLSDAQWEWEPWT